MARDNGLSALIGDGTHKLNPITIPDRMDKGQLYTVHAVVRGGVKIPILYAITRHKNIATYRTIFRRLRKITGESTRTSNRARLWEGSDSCGEGGF
ncbi:hypothetical protein Aduo_018526 [Ancylostoma duodenale]